MRVCLLVVACVVCCGLFVADASSAAQKEEPAKGSLRAFRQACAKASAAELKGKDVVLAITYYQVRVEEIAGKKSFTVEFKESLDDGLIPNVEVSLRLATSPEDAVTWKKLEPQTRVLVKGQVKDLTTFNIVRRWVDTKTGKQIEKALTSISVQVDKVALQEVVGKGDPAQEEAKKKLREWAGDQPVAKALIGVWDCPGSVQYEFRADGSGVARGSAGRIDHMFVYALKGKVLRNITDRRVTDDGNLEAQVTIEIAGDLFKMTASNGYVTNYEKKP